MQTAAADNTIVEEHRATFDRFFASLGQGFNAYLERLARTDEVRQLHAMSDAQLAGLGIRRDDIVRHVFRDKIMF